MEEALELLKKPRMGNVMLAFKRAKYMPEVMHEGPHPKKKKEEKEHEGKERGYPILLNYTGSTVENYNST